MPVAQTPVGAADSDQVVFGLVPARTMAADCVVRAHQVLADAELTDSWLDAIADWVVSRKN